MMTVPSSSAPRTALGLYRALIRYSQTLTLSDPEYFRRRVRQEFERSREAAGDAEEIQRRLDRGRALLEKKRVV